MNKNIFIAIDTSNINKAKKIISKTQTKELNIAYKFGLEFWFSKSGRSFISKLNKKHKIFADLKISDIPNTAKSVINSIRDLNINYLTIHIGSGLETLKAVKKISNKIKIVGVTTLTSLNNKSLKETGHTKNIKNLVIHQAKLASKAKLDALVCSAHEVKYVKKFFKKEIITPGIRLNSLVNDQKRVLTPMKAFAEGSNWLVIGRSITKGNIKKNIQNLIDHLNK